MKAFDVATVFQVQAKRQVCLFALGWMQRVYSTVSCRFTVVGIVLSCEYFPADDNFIHVVCGLSAID